VEGVYLASWLLQALEGIKIIVLVINLSILCVFQTQ
jgi:hypothetical protein